MTKFERICIDQIPPYATIFFVLLSVIVFYLRSPVLFVDDDYFSSLYGVRREHLKRVETSAELFRRVKFVRIAARTYNEAVVFAVQDASKRPYCVLFPNRYAEAARLYTEAEPKIKTFIFNGMTAAQNVAANNTVYVENDTETDLYRAGLCAALLAKHYRPSYPEEIYEILLYESGNFPETARTAFGKVFEGNKEFNVQYIYSGGFGQPHRDGVVLWGQALDFLHTQLDLTLPVILFSWLEPSYTPEYVKVIIDDSPLSVIPAVLKAAKKKPPDSNTIRIPSKFNIMQKHVNSLSLQFKLRRAFRAPLL
ncbi:hypothetical protein AGMMS50212_02370 [Spirochaetia bacterium]|nr:hypothetical protein AGMMS50212_02370 [Spirochaetia bacterium]